jgi:predicted secreted protein
MQTMFRTLVIATLFTLTSLKADDTSITTREGKEFRIQLVENPSTGFSWFMQVSSFDTHLLRLIKNRFIAGVGIGAPGTRIFRFRALEEGSTTIFLQYRGPGDTLGDTKTINVTIE